MAFSLMACTDEPFAPTLTLSSIPENHCALRVTLSTQQALPDILESQQGDRTRIHQTQWVALSENEYQTVIMGLSADMAVTVSAVQPSDAHILDAEATTAPLPADLPHIEQTVTDTLDPNTLTVFPLIQFTPKADPEWGYLVAVDAQGTVIWYHDINHATLLFSMTDRETILYSRGAEALIEHHPRTGTVSTWEATNHALDTVHHEAHSLEDGGWAILSTEHRGISDFPDDMRYNIIGDVLAEVDAEGSVVWETSVLDFIDPTTTFTEDMHSPFWEQWPYQDIDTPKDWSHGNAMVWNDSRHEWMTSLRNIDSLAAFSRETGTLTWTFGPDGTFALAEGGRWFSRQHAPVWTSDNTVLLYDNGLQRADATEDEVPYTRVVEYALDFDTFVATELWSYEGEIPYLAPIVGQVSPLAEGKLMITDGAILGGNIVQDGQNYPHFSARILDLDKENKVQSELIIGTPADINEPGYIVYRSHRTTLSQFLGTVLQD